jgi:hypothetical protein
VCYFHGANTFRVGYIPEIGMRPMGITHYTCIYVPVHILFPWSFLSSFQCSKSSFWASSIRIWIFHYFTDLDLDLALDPAINKQKFKNNLNCYCLLLLNDWLDLKIYVNYLQ